MKKLLLTLSIVSICLFSATSSYAKLYSYSDLHLKDFDEMNKLVISKVDAALDIIQVENDSTSLTVAATLDARADQKASELLREALQLILSRPNQDNMVEKLLPDVRRQLKNINSYDYTLQSITGEAISGLQNKKTLLKYRVTYLFLLENLMAEIQPQVDNSPLTQKIFQKIRDAKVEIPKEVAKERRRRMYKQFSPSEVAEKILDAHFKRTRQSKSK